MNRAIVAFLCLLIASPGFAQRRPDETVEPGPLSYGILLSGVAPIDWYGEPLVLFWSRPSVSHSQNPMFIVGLDYDPDALIAIRVGVELVGFAAYDPRPCALGNTAVLSTTGGVDFNVIPPFPTPCGTTLQATIGNDGFAYNFPAVRPMLQNTDCSQSPLQNATYVVSYFANPPYFTSHASGCTDGKNPFMGFILGRLVLL